MCGEPGFWHAPTTHRLEDFLYVVSIINHKTNWEPMVYGGYVDSTLTTLLHDTSACARNRAPLRAGSVYVMEQCGAQAVAAIRTGEQYAFSATSMRQYLFVVGPLAHDPVRVVVLIVTLVPVDTADDLISKVNYDFAVYHTGNSVLSSDRFCIPVISLPDRLCYDSAVPITKDRSAGAGYFAVRAPSCHRGAMLMQCPTREAIEWFDSVLCHFIEMPGFGCAFADLVPLQRMGVLFNPACPSAAYLLPKSSQALIECLRCPTYAACKPPCGRAGGAPPRKRDDAGGFHSDSEESAASHSATSGGNCHYRM